MSAPLQSLEGRLNAEFIWPYHQATTSTGLFAPIGMMSTRLVGPGGFHFRKRVDAQGRPRSVHARQGSLLRLLDLFDVMPLKSSLPPKPKPEPKPGQPPPPPRPPPAPPGPFPGDKDK